MKGFASDNYAGALPEVILAIATANAAHARSYGADELTTQAREMFCQLLGQEVKVYFVFNGTGANVLSLSIGTQSYSAVLCSDIAHIYADESSAPETFTGCRIFPLKSNEQGKLTTEVIEPKLLRIGDVHYAQPSVLSITQATEYGTVYTLEEIGALSKFCKQHNLYLHIDGARLLNAVASLGTSYKEMLADTGVDIVSFGGTKAGMLYGEAVVILNPALQQHAPFKHKQSMQLSSKNRFIAAQFLALLKEDIGLNAAKHANAMAQYLGDKLRALPQIKITRPIQANGVFAIFPKEIIAPLQAQFPFYEWDETTHEVRLMCSWDTTVKEVDLFVRSIGELVGS